MTAAWPTVDDRFLDAVIERETGVVFDIVRAIREIRNKLNIGRNVPLDAIVGGKDEATIVILERGRGIMTFLGGLGKLEIGRDLAKPPLSASTVCDAYTLSIPLEGKIDLKGELARQQATLSKTTAVAEGIRAKLANPSFAANAPEEIVDAERERLESFSEQINSIRGVIADLERAMQKG
ncbi:MAG: hypothetical protein A2Z34_00945 [Planctomycetes bacterium RBG_16_59_8]|nr:MAG: hypothetical protein A2Z34_00945 [Planctomycetes bacterium RBG_16_59_8]